MATVTMDLNELDSIKADRAKAYSEVKAMSETIAEKDKEIAKVLADKRTVKITSTPEFDGSFEFDNYRSTLINDIISVVQSFINDRNNYGLRIPVGNLQNQVRRLLADSVRSIHSTQKEEISYINFDDVLADLRDKAEAKTGAELGTLRANVQSLSAQLQEKDKTLKAKYEKQLAEEAEQHHKAIEAADKNFKALVKAFEDLKHDKDTRKREKVLEDRIAELEAQLAKKKFWSSWF